MTYSDYEYHSLAENAYYIDQYDESESHIKTIDWELYYHNIVEEIED